MLINMGYGKIQSIYSYICTPIFLYKMCFEDKYGRSLNIGKACYINALSKGGLLMGENVSMGYATYIYT